jgi:hypothetical protein
VSHRAETQAERVARNDAIFRDANEGIRSAAADYDVMGQVPFICECADPTCTEIIRLDVTEYEQVRKQSTHFINAPGHHRGAVPYVRVVESRDGYDVVEKLGQAAETAAELDSRGA